MRHHDRRYYGSDAPEISDEAYDALWHELKALEAAHPDLVVPESPTQRVAGAPVASLETAPHVAPMLSLDSSAKEEAFRQFDARVRRALGEGAAVRYWLEPKIDGLSIELVYEGGRLARAVTRGDGAGGEVITANARTIRPCRSSSTTQRAVPPLLSVRGEVFMPLQAFDDINEEL